MNSNGTELNKSFTYIEHRAGAVGREGFGELNPSPHSWIFTSVSPQVAQGLPVLAPMYSLPLRSEWPVHTALKCGTEPIPYVKLHFRDRRGGASLRYRNRAEVIVLIYEQKPYLVSFSYRRKRYPVQCEHGLKVTFRIWETAHLPLPWANINTYFSLGAKWWLRGGVGGQFPRNLNWSSLLNKGPLSGNRT